MNDTQTSQRAPWIAAVALAGLVAGSPALSHAQSTPNEDPQERVEETLEVEGAAPELPALSAVSKRLGLEAEDLPGSLTTVGHPLLEEQAATTLSDVLVNVAGVNVQTGNGPFDIFFVRGFDSISSALILVDGVPDPESTMLHLYNVDQVEVLKGGGFLFGGRSLAGTINLQRKTPVDENFVGFGLTAGSHAFYEATLDVNHGLGEGKGLRVNGLWQSADNYRDAESDVWAINPTFSWSNERTRILASFEHVDEERLPDAGVPVLDGAFGVTADDLRDLRYGSSYDVSDQQVDRLQVHVEHELGNDVKLRGKLYYSKLDWQSNGTLLVGAAYFPIFGFDQAFRTLTQLQDEQKQFGAQFESVQTFETGTVDHELISGVEIGRYQDAFDLRVGQLPTVSVVAPVIAPNEFVFDFPFAAQAGDVRSDVSSPYVIDRMTFSDAFQLLVGARYDVIDTRGRGTASNRESKELSPFLGVVLSPTDTLSVYGQYATSFEPPSSLTVGVLEPEDGEQIELGLNLSFLGGKLKAHAAVYQLDKENIAVPSATGVLRQTGDQRSKGFELEVSGLIADVWRLRFAYARTDAELTEFREFDQATQSIVDWTGNTPGWVPENLASLWLSRRFDGGFGFGVGGRFVGEQYLGPDNSFELDSYGLLDAALFYAWDRLEFHVDLENLTDEEYFTRAFTRSALVPASGLTVRGGLRYSM
jgi:TonB-dependent siderophore receptor